MEPKIAAETKESADSWEQAVVESAVRLEELGVAEPRYTTACVESLHKNGPYIVLTPGVALAHARPEDGATGLGVSLLRLERPVVFGHPKNDPVDLVFAFCTPEAGGHIALLKKLALALGKGLGAKLREASDDQLESVLKEALEG